MENKHFYITDNGAIWMDETEQKQLFIILTSMIKHICARYTGITPNTLPMRENIKSCIRYELRELQVRGILGRELPEFDVRANVSNPRMIDIIPMNELAKLIFTRFEYDITGT